MALTVALNDRVEALLFVGEPVDDFESDRREWVPLASIPDLIVKVEIPSSNAVAALLMVHLMRVRHTPAP